jgi:hypothetical protein
MSEASFDRVISDHLALAERNKRLEHRMPLDGYREHAADGSTAAAPESEPVVATDEHWLDPDSSWDATKERPLPDFDWGDD